MGERKKEVTLLCVKQVIFSNVCVWSGFVQWRFEILLKSTSAYVVSTPTQQLSRLFNFFQLFFLSSTSIVIIFLPRASPSCSSVVVVIVVVIPPESTPGATVNKCLNCTGSVARRQLCPPDGFTNGNPSSCAQHRTCSLLDLFFDKKLVSTY